MKTTNRQMEMPMTFFFTRKGMAMTGLAAVPSILVYRRIRAVLARMLRWDIKTIES